MRFRRSVRFGMWFRLNFGKKCISVSAGLPGARKTLHSGGRLTTTFGLPGRGMSWTKIDQPGDPANGNAQSPEPAAPATNRSSPRAVTHPYGPSDLELIFRVQKDLNNGYTHFGACSRNLHCVRLALVACGKRACRRTRTEDPALLFPGEFARHLTQHL